MVYRRFTLAANNKAGCMEHILQHSKVACVISCHILLFLPFSVSSCCICVYICVFDCIVPSCCHYGVIKHDDDNDQLQKYKRFPKLGAQNPYQISHHSVPSGTFGFYTYDLLLVINCIQGRILHRIAFDMSTVVIFGYACCV